MDFTKEECPNYYGLPISNNNGIWYKNISYTSYIPYVSYIELMDMGMSCFPCFPYFPYIPDPVYGCTGSDLPDYYTENLHYYVKVKDIEDVYKFISKICIIFKAEISFLQPVITIITYNLNKSCIYLKEEVFKHHILPLDDLADLIILYISLSAIVIIIMSFIYIVILIFIIIIFTPLLIIIKVIWIARLFFGLGLGPPPPPVIHFPPISAS